MPMLTLLACFVFVVVLTMQAKWTRRFVKDFDLQWPSEASDTHGPVAVILPLRGADPSLSACLQGLVHQRFGAFTLHVVLDRADDPAAQVVNEVLQSNPQSPIRVHVLKNPLPTCGLKVSALTQVIEELSESIEIFVLVDADARPDPEWLRDLIAPFSDPAIGATSGIRWYCPRTNSLPDIVRRQWNGDAVVQMHSFQIPWGGSLAIRRDVACDPDNLKRWRRSICEDIPLAVTLKELGLRLQFVSNVILPNDESTDLAGCFQFIRRQILFTLRDHPARRLFFAFGLLKTAWPVALIVATIINFSAGEIAWAWTSTSVFFGSYVAQIVLLKISSGTVRRALTRRLGGVHRSPFDLRTLSAALITMSLTAAAFLSALTQRQVRWRGITYELHGATSVRMVRYLPYQPRDYVNASSHKSIA